MKLLTLKNIGFAPKNDQGFTNNILEGVNLKLKKGEITSLLGRSGSGKSTLLRIIAGLIQPTSGEIIYDDPSIKNSKNSVAMVFQTFALLPWLTVLENIEIALKAQGLSKEIIKERATHMIEIIGLQGYESAYPKELSGGMKQRVCFARALAIHPRILLLDEPFSSLDIITAQTLRTDFLDLWADDKVPIDNAMLITHNIEEALLISDKIYIFASNPGRIVGEIEVKLPHPRDRLDPEFTNLVEEIYNLMINKLSNQPDICNDGPLPKTLYSNLTNFLDFLSSAPYNGKADLPELSSGLDLEINDLFPVIDGLQLLKFVDINKDIITISSSGKLFVSADQKTKKQVFAEHLIQYVPLASYIRRTIQNKSNKIINKEVILEELEKTMPSETANLVLKSIISWGRFAGLFIYNDLNKTIYIEE
jgi:NitT/TauT family transport system ATP-binding protein